MANIAQGGTKRKKNTSNDNAADDDVVAKKVVKKRTRRSVPRDSPPQRSSVYRGVTRHRWTGRYEAHLWDKNCWNPTQNKKGRQVYLGAYDEEEAAAHAYDLAALKYWGHDTILNFPLSTYQNELQEMDGQSREEYIGSLRRKSSGFSRGVSKFRGVARHHHNGRWEARIGRVFGNKYLYLGTYGTQEEAATAYDVAAIQYRGINAVTNFDLSRYINCFKPIDKDMNYINNIDMINTTPIQPADFDLIQMTNDDMLQQYPYPDKNQLNLYSSDETSSVMMHSCPATSSSSSSSSELDLLLSSSNFNEMMEMSTILDFESTPQITMSSTDSRADALTQGCSSFLINDIQTYFEYCTHDQNAGESLLDEDYIFGDLKALVSDPLFLGEFSNPTQEWCNN